MKLVDLINEDINLDDETCKYTARDQNIIELMQCNYCEGYHLKVK